MVCVRLGLNARGPEGICPMAPAPATLSYLSQPTRIISWGTPPDQLTGEEKNPVLVNSLVYNVSTRYVGIW